MMEWRRRRPKSTKYKYGATRWKPGGIVLQSYTPDVHGFPLNVLWWKDKKGRVRKLVVEDVVVDESLRSDEVGFVSKTWADVRTGRSYHAYDALIPGRQT